MLLLYMVNMDDEKKTNRKWEKMHKRWKIQWNKISSQVPKWQLVGQSLWWRYKLRPNLSVCVNDHTDLTGLKYPCITAGTKQPLQRARSPISNER